tara:strand:+ start:160 stop:357 length:198 start_codon:yes stop_codon:yes gene_type:complete
MLNSKRVPLVDEDLLRTLKKKFPPIEYKQGDNVDTFANDAIFRAGQRDIINQLEIWFKQKNGGKL